MFSFEWFIGCVIYVDEKTIGLKGRHVNNMSLSYKSKGTASGGCYFLPRVYLIFLRNEGVPKE